MSVAHLTLKLPDGTLLGVDVLLSSIIPTGTTSATALIIESRNDSITMDEYMTFRLPRPVYDNPVARPNSSGSHSKKPTHVFLWPGFEQAVVRWVEDNHQQHSRRLERPVFVDGIVITEEVQSLQPFIKLNLLDISAKCFIPSSEFKARRQIPSCVGEPDHLMTRDGEIVAIVEEKGNWTLTTGDIVNNYNSNHSISKAINQLNHYMRLNHRKFGILSSYEHTWFAYRSQECSICDDIDGHETLFVSSGIAYYNQNPSVLQSFSYFNSLVNYDEMDSPPTSKRLSRTNSATLISRTTSPISSPRHSIIIPNSALSSQPPVNQESQDFDADDFRFDKLLGEGRCKVYLDKYESNPIALKVADIAKNREMLPELLNEILIYGHLATLQGNGIPRILCHGYIESVLYCVGVSVCGSVPLTLNDRQKHMLIDTLENIHRLGILHNDIKRENILVDPNGNPYIIDFGFATINTALDAQSEEKAQLQACIEAF